MFKAIKEWAALMQHQVLVLWFAMDHPKTPWYVTAIAIMTIGYLLSPIDLIPDFIPVLGLIDELLVIPLLLWIMLRLTPAAALDWASIQARIWRRNNTRLPKCYIAAAIVLAIQFAACLSLLYLFIQKFN